MSNVADVLDNTNNQDKCLVFYDKSSIDSIFGAGIIRYICEEITNVSEVVVCKDISEMNVDNYVIDNTFLNVSFIGCYPLKDSLLKSYIETYNDNILFVLSNKTDYSKVRNINRSVKIEYSEKDCCSLQLYKIAFGEFKDRVPNILHVISAYEMKAFDNENYYDGLHLAIGFRKYFLENSFEHFYQNIMLTLCNQEAGYNNFDYSSYVNNGKNLSTYYNEYLINNSSVVKNDQYTFNGNKKANCLFTNSMLDLSMDNIKNEFNDEYIFALSRKDNNNWNAEFIYNSYNSYASEISYIITNDETISYSYTYSYSYNFVNCGEYMKRYYKGDGVKNHGFAVINHDTLLKIIKNKKF